MNLRDGSHGTMHGNVVWLPCRSAPSSQLELDSTAPVDAASFSARMDQLKRSLEIAARTLADDWTPAPVRIGDDRA